MTEMANLEYDRFGPWVIEISELDPPPPLFLPYLTREEEPLFSIKIPRKIDRRDAHPGMNLYDFMVNLYQDDLLILQRVEDEVRAETFFYRDIQLIRCESALLRGNLHLVMPQRTFDLPFNNVSQTIMLRLIELLRRRYTDETTDTAVPENPDFTDEDLSYYFSRLLAYEKIRRSDMQVLAAQPETPIGAYESSELRKFLLGAIDKRLLESLYWSDGRELKIIDRGGKYKYRFQTVYETDTYYLPVGKIVGAFWEPDVKNTAVIHLTLTVRGGQVSFAFVRDNASLAGYARFLAAVVGEPSGAWEAPLHFVTS